MNNLKRTFWKSKTGEIDVNLNNIQFPIPLPDNFSLTCYDTVTNDILEFINTNYTPNKELFYTKEYFDWYFKDSIYKNLGIINNNELIGFISGKVVKLYINKEIYDFILINHLTVKKDMRNKNIAILLIKQISQYFLIQNYKYALYSTTVKSPEPLCLLNSYLYYSNPKKFKDYNYKRFSFKNHQKLNIVTNINNDLINKINNKLNNKYKVYFPLTKNFCNSNLITIMTNNLNTAYIIYYRNDEYTNGQLLKQYHLVYYCLFDESINLLSFIKNSLLTLTTMYNIDRVRFTDCMDNLSFLDNRDEFIKGTADQYYYLFNYNLNIPINKNQICLFLN